MQRGRMAEQTTPDLILRAFKVELRPTVEQRAARELVLEAQRRATTTAEAAEALGMSVRTLERLRADFPELAVHIRERGRPPKAEARRASGSSSAVLLGPSSKAGKDADQ